MNRKLIAMLIIALMVVSTIGVVSVTTATPRAEARHTSIPTYLVLRASNYFPEPGSIVALTVTLKAFQGPRHNYPLANRYVWIYVVRPYATMANLMTQRVVSPFLVKTNAHGQARVYFNTNALTARNLQTLGLREPAVKVFALFSRDGRYSGAMSNFVGIRVITRLQTYFSNLYAGTFTLTGTLVARNYRGAVAASTLVAQNNYIAVPGRLVQLLKARCPGYTCLPQATGIYARTDRNGVFVFRLNSKGLPGPTQFGAEFRGDHLYKGSVSNSVWITIPGPLRT